MDGGPRAREEKDEESEDSPRKVLTEPGVRVGNGGLDNEHANLIMCTNDILRAEHTQGNLRSFRVLSMLGEGTFGQVVKCEDCISKRQVAVKVIKNKQAYHNQALVELHLLKVLNEQYDHNNTAHIVRLLDHFSYKNHLCLVFEMLGANLYEYIKGNGFRGMPCSLVRNITKQLLDALGILREARIIHCDLKPENILFVKKGSSEIKLIDFGSACLDFQTVYSYVQSRFYRSPEVLLGLPYDAAMDMWSLGCIVAELFMGLPMFPGQSQHNQICRIVKLLGCPESYLLDRRTTAIRKFFNVPGDPMPPEDAGDKTDQKCTEFSLKSAKQFARETQTEEVQNKKYFNGEKMDEILLEYPFKRNLDADGKAAEIEHRKCLLHFIRGLLRWDPAARWSPLQAAQHPFITGQPLASFTEPEPEDAPPDPRDPSTWVDESMAPWDMSPDMRRPRVSEAHVQYNAQYQDGVYIGSPPSRLSICSNHSQASRGSIHLPEGVAGNEFSGMGRRESYNKASPTFGAEDGRGSHGSLDLGSDRHGTRPSVDFLQVPGSASPKKDPNSPENRSIRSISTDSPTKHASFRSGGKSASLSLPGGGSVSPLDTNFNQMRIAPQLQYLQSLRQEEVKVPANQFRPTAPPFNPSANRHSSSLSDTPTQNPPKPRTPQQSSRSSSLIAHPPASHRAYSPITHSPVMHSYPSPNYHGTSPPSSPHRFTAGRSPSSASNSPSRPPPPFTLSPSVASAHSPTRPPSIQTFPAPAPSPTLRKSRSFEEPKDPQQH